MCEHGTTVPVHVLIPADLSYTEEERWDEKPVDECISEIVDALTSGGVYTRSSCCGHGRSLGQIYTGRTLERVRSVRHGKDYVVIGYWDGRYPWDRRAATMHVGVAYPASPPVTKDDVEGAGA